MPAKTKRRKTKKSQKSMPPKIQGWKTSDEDEVALRCYRGEIEKMQVVSLESEHDYFGTFLVNSVSGISYNVEIRDLQKKVNSCDCADFNNNQLGTCKHIEKVLFNLKKLGVRKFKKNAEAGSSRIEMFLYWQGAEKQIKIAYPKKLSKKLKAFTLLEPFFSAENTLLTEPTKAFPAIMRARGRTTPAAFRKVRISQHIQPFVDGLKLQQNKEKLKTNFLKDVDAGKRSLDVLRFPLYPYQQQGMLHLAFKQRALLADEMGLGKTAQAIAACVLLRQLNKVNKVLVISTASLKTEWAEQIEKFIGLPTLIVQGARADRLQQYQQSSFFYLMNYEQLLRDSEDVQRILGPDVIILDEAQRIKNWQTKTAAAVKKIKSPYAFVLTGTPVENKIDDIYSIVQYLEPGLFGPLFRFNRDFYQLDENGKPIGYKNLVQLHERLRPILLRRLKSDVEGELPQRTVKNFFVEMAPEQQQRYEEYETYVARLVQQAKKRPLRKEEFERLQRFLSCMRMLCDTTYILDQKTRVSPKLDELEAMLVDLLSSPENKIIIFSEWERMLKLIKELAVKLNTSFAWHTGSVQQQKRRVEINRFKQEPDCRLFLSTDSGSVGLNLQNANVVINCDLPWNPAKLEQRIARAWRKHQTKAVQVINLITKDSIEPRFRSRIAFPSASS